MNQETREVIKYVKLYSKEGKEKLIEFYKDGKENQVQIDYFNEVFDKNLKLKTMAREIAYWGSFRCAKSFSQQLTIFLLCNMYPKLSVIYIRDTYDQLEDSVIKQFNNEFEWLGHYRYNKADRICKFGNGSELRFRTFERDTGILSTEYDVIAICQAEDIKTELFLQLLGRLSGKVLPHPILLTEGNPTSGFYKERYKDNANKHDELKIKFYEGRMVDNPFIPIDYRDVLIANYPKAWIARYVDGEWSNIDEVVFNEFRESVHVIDPIDFRYIKGLRQRGGFDYGYRTDSAMNWSFVDYDGVITIFDEWHKPLQHPDDFIKEAQRYYYELPGTGKIQKTLFVADYAIKRPDRDGRNLWDELTGKGMHLAECSKDEMNSISLVNMLFKQDRLKITRNCVNTIRQVLNWKWKKVKLGADKDAPDEPIDKDNHHCDNINYIVSNLEGMVTIDPKVDEYKKSLEYKNIQRQQSHISVS